VDRLGLQSAAPVLSPQSRLGKQLRHEQQKTYARVCTVIHRKALEKTYSEAENGLASIARALKYFFGGSVDATHMQNAH